MPTRSSLQKLVAGLLPGFLFASVASSQINSSNFYQLEQSRQLYRGSDSLISFCIRPVFNSSADYLNAIYANENLKTNSSTNIRNKKEGIFFLPVTLQQQYNTNHPYGINDGAMIPAKGYQGELAAGVFLKRKFLTLQLQPEFVFAQNSSFSSFPSQHSDSIWKSYYGVVLNMIDAPERFGSGSYLKLFPGQSALRFNYKKLSLGISTENLWWGPGVRNSLLMSNNAPGFAHLTFNSSAPVNTVVGSFEWQLVSGKLKSSGIYPPDTNRIFQGGQLYTEKRQDERYLNGLVVTWQPRWTKGLFLGAARVFYEYASDVDHTFEGYLPVIGKFFKRHLANEDERKRDQMISFFFRLRLEKEMAEVYGEFGRNDHSEDSRDFLLEPEHSGAYIIGFSKTFESPKNDVRLFGEVTNLQGAQTGVLRAQPTWYVHHQVRHGYTNNGQVIGAGIGPGASSQTLGLEWAKGFNRTGGFLERIVHNNDFYYAAFTPSEDWQKHWVDFSLNLTKCWNKGRMLYNANVSLVHSLNYEWYYSNELNCNIRLGLTYLL